jgi:hypothetical protein
MLVAGFSAAHLTGSRPPACVSGLDSDEQIRSGFRYDCSVYQVEYSRNLLFADGLRMQKLFDTVVDRTRSRLNVTRLRTMFGAKSRPHHNRAGGPPRLAAMIETPVYDLTNFKVHFGRLTLKAYTKGEHVLRFEAIVHNTKELNCRRGIDMFGEIVTRLSGMAERFCTTLDCVDIGFLPDHTLDELPTVADRSDPSRRHRPEPGPPAQRVGRGPRPGSLTQRLHRHRIRRAGPRDDRAEHGPVTAPGMPPTTCARFAGNTWSTNPTGPAATTMPPEPSPRC